jgi:RAB protein geranylgeranyltransferase component A
MLLQNNRKFNIDLSPNIFYSRGLIIELLISSDVSKYCEFRMLNQILTRRDDGRIEKVPTSRAEVFKSQMSVIEKRLMMQFVQSCMKDNDFADLINNENGILMSFKDFIESKKLPNSISHYLVNAVSMCPKRTDSAFNGLKEVKRFISSVNRFGDSPFLFALYGTGELSQCFCRYIKKNNLKM